jgi:HlyD family secretion protein
MKLPSKRTSLIALILLLAALAAYFWLGRSGKTLEERYQIQEAAASDLTQSVSANGTLNPVTVVSVGTQVSGTVKKLYVDFNSKVEKNQILVELDDSLLSAQARQSRANVINADASLKLAAANQKRMSTLFAQDYVSRQDLDTANQALDSAAANLAAAKAAADKDQVNLGNTVIRAPVSGVVTDRSVDVGQTVAASLQTPTLMKIAQDLSKMQIDSSFAEADIGLIKEGQPVRFNVDAFPNRPFKGVVKQIRLNPTIQSNVVTYDVVVSVENPEQKLLPGMTAYVNIVVAERKEVLTVPNAALRFRPAEQAKGAGQKPVAGEKKKRDPAAGTVYVLDGDQLRPVQVTLGITDNRNTEISGGDLKAGDRVVTGDNIAGAAGGKPVTAGGPPRMF